MNILKLNVAIFSSQSAIRLWEMTTLTANSARR